jgi:hypothetical protein
MLPETLLDGQPVEDYHVQADIFSGTRAEIRVDHALARFQPHQRVELTNVVDAYPPLVMRLIAKLRGGYRPIKTVYRLPMVVDYVTGRRVGLIDEASYLSRNRIDPEVL